jgi:hypothetical protein
VIPPRLVPFLRPELAPHEREDGLHGLLREWFPVDALIDGTGPELNYTSYELVTKSNGNYLDLLVTLRLSWWTNNSIDDVAEQPLCMLSFMPSHGRPYPSVLVALDREPDEVIEHVTRLVLDCKAKAELRLASAPRDVTPAELVFDNVRVRKRRPPHEQ